MKTESKNYRLPSYLLLTVGIILFIFSNGRWIIPIATWIAPVFLLAYMRSQRSKVKMALLFILIIISARIMLHGIIPSLLGILTYILTIYYAVIWFFPFVIDKWISPKIPGFSSTLIFPVAGVSAEFINNIFYGSWASVAYTQFDNLPFIQVGSLFGIWAITFLVMWFASVVIWMVDNNFKWDKIRKGVLIYTSILGIVLLYGGLRLGVFPPAQENISIVSFTPTEEIGLFNELIKQKGFSSITKMAVDDRQSISEVLDSVHNRLFDNIANNKFTPATIIMMPEGSIDVLEEKEDEFINRGVEFAIQNEQYFLLAYYVIPQQNPGILAENKAVLIHPNGEVLWHYLKAYPVPGSTNKPGNKIIPYSDTPTSRIGTVICYDMDFTRYINQAGKKNIDIMLAPSWDWKAIDPLHTRMAVFRSIENGFSLVRQTGNGLSIATDYQGRTLSAMDQFTSNDHRMISQVPIKGVTTVYSIIGDLFAWLCLFFLLLFIGFSIGKGKLYKSIFKKLG